MSVQQYLEDKKSGNQPLSSDLYRKLQEEILTGRLKAGGKLTETHICEKYKASRTPVREAIRQLEGEGLVELIPNRGAFVVGLSPQDISDILSMRSLLEVQATSWAAERITDHEMEQLKEIFDYMEYYTHRGDIEKMIRINAAFHQIIDQSSHNSIITRQLGTFQTYIQFASPDVCTLDTLNEILSEHQAIYHAIQSHDPKASELTMSEHLRRGYDRRQFIRALHPEKGEIHAPTV